MTARDYLFDPGHWLFDLGNWSIEGIWIPLLIWTVVALPAFVLLATRHGRASHLKYRMASALLAALPCGLVAAQLIGFGGETTQSLGIIVLPPIFIGADFAADAGLNWTPAHTAGSLLIVAMAAAAWRLGLLVAGYAQLRALRASLSFDDQSGLHQHVARLARDLHIFKDIRVAVSAHTGTPMTFGRIRPVIVLPAGLTEDPDDLHLALLHELIHIRRHDYVMQWIEQIVGAVFVIHPLVAIIRREASLLRETSCDADVVSITGSKGRYARLLYSFSATRRSPWNVAVGISLRENHLKKRLAAMKNAIDFSRLSSTKRIGLILGAVLFGISVTLIACSEQIVETSTPAPDEQIGKAAQDADVFIIVEEMPSIVGGLQSIQENLVYPESAMTAGVEGRVIIQFVVDKNGDVQQPVVVRGVESSLDAAALRAVEVAKFEPGRQRGEAVDVKMSLPITFKLPGGSDSASRSAASQRVDGQADGDVTMPELIGGLASIQQEMTYPQTAKESGVEGRVIVEFTVDKEGRVIDAQIVRGVGSGLDAEALRVVEKSLFDPGRKDGEPTEVKLTLPVTFKLPAE